MRHPYVLTLIALLFQASLQAQVSPGPGDLDPSFDGDGKLFTQIGTANDQANAVAIDSQGRIVVVGDVQWLNIQNWPHDVFLTRYNPDGTLDPSFGTGGTVITNFTPTPYTNGDDRGNAVAIDGDGKILVAGYAIPGWFQGDFLVARYTESGVLDITFGPDGTGFVKIRPTGSYYAVAEAMVLQPDGKILVAGSTGDFALARLKSDGTLDSDFGVDGFVTTDLGCYYAGSGYATALALQKDGKIVVGGRCQNNNSEGSLDFALVRYNANGSLDSTFDGDGKLTMNVSTNAPGANPFDTLYAIAIDNQGKILITGDTNDKKLPLVRLKPNGSLDESFGTGGIARVELGTGGAKGYDLKIDPKGNIVVAGTSFTPTTVGDMAVVRFLPNGTLDQNFGSEGFVTIDFWLADAKVGARSEEAYALALQPDSRIIVAGTSNAQAKTAPTTNQFDVAIARLIAYYTADLEVALKASPESMKEGETATYTITVTNNGPDEVTNIFVTDTLPGAASFVSATHAGCAEAMEDCESGCFASIHCSLGSLASGGSISFNIVAKMNNEGSYTNTAHVWSEGPSVYDPIFPNNQATVSLTVNPPPPSVCGNGVVEAGELCDDGNTLNGDGCSSTCTVEPKPVCGNKIVEAGEQCDDGNIIGQDGCSSSCVLEIQPQVITPTSVMGGGCSCAINSHDSGQNLNPLFYLAPLVLLLVLRLRRTR